MAVEEKVVKIYDLQVKGTPNVMRDLERVNVQLEKIKKTKQNLDLSISGAKEEAALAKLNGELQKQSILEEKLTQQKLKSEQEVLKLMSLEDKAQQNRLKNMRAVEQQAKLNSNVPFTSNVGDDGKIIDNQVVKGATQAVSEFDKEMLDAQLSASAWAKSTKEAGVETANTKKAVVDLSKATAEEKILLANATAELKNRIREELNAKGSLENRRAALIRLRTEYDRLSPAERDTSWGKRLEKTISQVNEQVLTLEKGTGRAQRDVGNYAKASAGQFEVLSRAASKTMGALRTVANLIPGFGIGGLVGLGVTGLIELADAMGVLEQRTEAENKQIQFFGEIHKQLVQSIAKETVALKENYEVATNTTLSWQDRGKAVDELIKMYPEYFTNANREKLLNGELQGSYDLLTKSIRERAEATAKTSILTKLYEEKIAAQLKLEKLTAQNAKDEFYYSQENGDELRAIINLKDNEIKQIEKSMRLSKESFGNDVFYIDEKTRREAKAAEAKAKRHAMTGETDKTDEAERKKKEREAEREAKRLADTVIQRHKEEYESKKALIEKERDEAINAGKDEFEAKSHYWAQLFVLNETYESHRTKLSKKQLEEQNVFNASLVESTKKTNDEILKELEKSAEVQAKLDEEALKRRIENTKLLQQAQKDATDNLVSQEITSGNLDAAGILSSNSFDTERARNQALQDSQLEHEAKLLAIKRAGLESRRKLIEQQYANGEIEERDYVNTIADLNEAMSKNMADSARNGLDETLVYWQRFQESLGQIVQAMDSVNQKIIQPFMDLQKIRMENEHDYTTKLIDEDEQRKLNAAQSQAEKDAIEEEAKAKREEEDRAYGEKKKQMAIQELQISTAISAVKALEALPNYALVLANEALIGIEYALALSKIKATKFEYGGYIPYRGGQFKGPSHAQGGIRQGDKEFEGDELAIINKRSANSNQSMTVTGTPKQIASALNSFGGGVSFAPGASVQPPIFRSYTQNDSSDLKQMMMDTLALIQMEAAKIVVLNPHAVGKALDDYSKNVNLASV